MYDKCTLYIYVFIWLVLGLRCCEASSLVVATGINL